MTVPALLSLATLTVGAPGGFEHFITRSGAKLMDGDREFRFVGANMPGLVLPYDWTLYLPERLHLPTPWEQEDGFKTLDQMNLRVVRTWNLPMRAPDQPARPYHYILGPGEFNDEAFKTVDHLLALANQYRVRVILDLSAEAGDYLGGSGTYAAHRHQPRSAFWTDPQLRADYQATVRYVLTRVNSVTGVPYRDDKAILAWQFGNEMHSATPAWLSEMAAYMKSLDPHHLVADTRHMAGEPLLADANIDLYTRHLYGGNAASWLGVVRQQVAALKGERPFFIGEYGPYIDGKQFTHANVVAEVGKFLDGVRQQPGIAGSLLWSMYFHHQDGGYYWHQIMTYPAVWSYHYPGFASADAQRESGLMTTLREQAFRLQDLPVPPVSAPEPPVLLPLGELPLLSWRGSAGASGYDVERAPTVDGPWTVAARDVSDAEVAYRPLWSDAGVRAGERWCYRVIARNAGGASPPSNSVGPVTFDRGCLVDELQDFSRVAAHSPGLTLDNAYNALYAEYLFRAHGGAGEWVRYTVPGELAALRVVAFTAQEPADLQFLVAADGAAWTTLQPRRTARPLPNPPGGAAGKQRRTLVEYSLTAPPGQRQLKLEWTGPLWLDRVEVEHR